MTAFRFRCKEHGDFIVCQPMADTTPTFPCDVCGDSALKVLGAAFQYPYGGRAAFHDGPEHDGQTVRETTKRWQEGWKAAGINYESKTRWI